MSFPVDDFGMNIDYIPFGTMDITAKVTSVDAQFPSADDFDGVHATLSVSDNGIQIDVKHE